MISSSNNSMCTIRRNIGNSKREWSIHENKFGKKLIELIKF